MTGLRTLLATIVAVLGVGTAHAQAVFVTDFYNNSILRVNSLTRNGGSHRRLAPSSCRPR